MASKQFHVMMFPWLAFGHMIPYLEFSKKLASKGIRVSFVSTPRNLQRLPPFVEVLLPPVDGLPESQATIDLQLDQIQYLKKAFDGLQASFEKLVREDLPDLILFDFIQCWIPGIAAKFGVPSGYFSVHSASTLAFIGPANELKHPRMRIKPEDFTVVPEWIPFPSLVAQRPDRAAVMFHNMNSPDVSGKSTGHRFAATLEGCDFVAVRSCRKFEGTYVDLLQELYQKPVFPVGLLPGNTVKDKINHPDRPSWSDSFKWLDKQERKSVVFVGFGTEYKMPVKQVHELAHGIELSKLPFIWILRKPEGLDISELLPAGFLDRTSDRGIVCLGWAPQPEILAHPAVGGCLFHLGGILMPMVADQGLNAKLLCEKGIGFHVPSNEDGAYSQDSIAMSLRFVMAGQEGKHLRYQAAEMQTIFANQDLHDNYIEEFINYISTFRKGKV
ncbi:UDPGT domain-containing protein [Salix suchowensis]|nr:UDPGT domain-containing protein [Salix suchowensis]